MYISSFSSTVSPPTEADHSIDSSSPSTPVRADLPSRSPSHDNTPDSQRSTLTSGGARSLETTPNTTRKRSGGPSPPSFKLPKFDAAIERALSQDSIYDSSTRAKLVRKSCEHLEGFCLEHGLTITKEQQDNLARILLARAQKSLADPPGLLKGKQHNSDEAVSS